MSWLYSQALVAEYLADTCSDGAPFAQSSGSPTPQAYLSPDKMTAFSRLSRFGMTFAALTDDRGAALLTWYRAAFPARTSAPQAKAPESTASDPACGAKWHELSVKYDPATRSWKTHRSLWDEDLPWSSVTLPKWGSMRAGVLSERMTSALPTAETDAGLWPTPKASEPGMSAKTSGRHYTKSTHLTMQVAIAEGMINPTTGRMWPTPTANNYEQQDIGKMLERRERLKATKKNGNGFGLTLGNAVKMWPTPKANDAEKRGNFDVTNPRNGLPAAAKMFATPQARDFRSGQATRWDDPRRTRNLNDQIAKWPTPTVNDSKNCTLPPSQIHHDNIPGALLRDGEAPGGQLNPTWVEWLMGWPLGWTDLKPLATDKCHSAPPQPGASSMKTEPTHA